MSYPFQQPGVPRVFEQRPRRTWLPAAIFGAAILIAAGLVGAALILKDRSPAGVTTCQAWKQTRLTLLAVPSLPNEWTWATPGIDNAIRLQNAAVGNALDLFENEISSKPADVAQAARRYLAARRQQMQTLANHTYAAADGQAVDTALDQMDQLCGIQPNGQPA